MNEYPEHKRYVEQMSFERYAPKHKEIPGSRMNWSSNDSPSTRGIHPQCSMLSEKDTGTLVKVMVFPLGILAGAIPFPIIVMREQAPHKIARLNRKFDTPLLPDKIFYAACLYLAFEIGCIFFLDVNPFTCILASLLSTIDSVVKHLALGVRHLLAGGFTV